MSDATTWARHHDAIEDLISSTLGADRTVAALSPAAIQAHHIKNPKCMLLIWEKEGDTRTLRGLLINVALTDAAIDGLQRGQINSGHQIVPALTEPDFLNCRALYMMGIYAENRMMGGLLEGEAEDLFQRLRASNPRLELVYGRGSTPQGKHILQHNKFVELDASRKNHIYVLRLA